MFAVMNFRDAQDSKECRGYIDIREWPSNYDFAGINFCERPKNLQNSESFYPRNPLPLK